MDICIDVGNTTVVFGFYKDDKFLKRFSFNTNTYHTVDELVVVINQQIKECNLPIDETRGIIYSSVVPSIDIALKGAIDKIFKKEVLTIHPGIKTGLIIRVDNPNEVGSDLVADLVGAKEKYNHSCLIVDLGTASKILYLDDSLCFSSCLIFSGLGIVSSALSSKAALLPEIGFTQPKDPLKCHNTIDAMNTGVLLSYINGVKGTVEQFLTSIGKNIPVILTGGIGSYLKNYFNDYEYDENLTIDGLFLILKKQK